MRLRGWLYVHSTILLPRRSGVGLLRKKSVRKYNDAVLLPDFKALRIHKIIRQKFRLSPTRSENVKVKMWSENMYLISSIQKILFASSRQCF